MYHNANNNPLCTWWQPYWCWSLQAIQHVRYIKQHQHTLPLWHQGQRADQDIIPLRDALCCLCSPWAHAESTEIFFKRIAWLYNSNMWVWPSYHQLLIHTLITQPSGDIPNVHTWLKNCNYYFLLAIHNGVTNSIIGLYMTFTSNNIHGIKDQGLRQYHDNYKKLSYIIYDLYHSHLSATSRMKTYICPSSKESSESKQICGSRNISII